MTPDEQAEDAEDTAEWEAFRADLKRRGITHVRLARFVMGDTPVSFDPAVRVRHVAASELTHSRLMPGDDPVLEQILFEGSGIYYQP